MTGAQFDEGGHPGPKKGIDKKLYAGRKTFDSALSKLLLKSTDLFGEDLERGGIVAFISRLKIGDGVFILLRLSMERWEKLSDRQKEVACKLGHGLQNKEIAKALSIAPTTVETHLRTIFAKMAMTSRAELAVYCRLISGRQD
jgi:DNA-binding NarL/FixJ family response regulator